MLGFPVSVDDPAFAPARVNAEPFVRDEPAITTASLDRAGLASADVTIAVGSAPNDIIAAAVDVLSGWTGRPPVRVDADHEVYLTEPAVLTGIVTMLDQYRKAASRRVSRRRTTGPGRRAPCPRARRCPPGW